MEKQNILIVEDDKKIAELLHDYLKQADFNVSMLFKGDRVVSDVRQTYPDLILLDIMLPDKDGLSICSEIRSFSRVPIMIISAKVDEIDRLLGLELGADDYICKPFSPREVVVRIKAILRRVSSKPEEQKLTAGPITIKPESHNATIGENDLCLTPNEFELLRVLISRPGCVFTRGDLVSRIQGYDFDGGVRTIDTHVKNLRKKVSGFLPGNKIIQTIYGVGYSVCVPKSGNIVCE
jgi:two-component system, OmpR family, response regulator BaeR